MQQRLSLYSPIHLIAAIFFVCWAFGVKADTDIDHLLELSFEELMNIKVSTGSKYEQNVQNSPSLISVIKAQEIQTFGANNLYEVLERVTSFYMTESFFYPQNVVAIRGDLQSHADNHVLILINGRPFRESYSGGVNFPFYNAFPIQAIEKIEIIRGPGSVLYGTNAMSGVINVITRQQGKDSNKLSLTSGSFATSQLQGFISRQLDELAINGAFNLFKEDGWQFALFDQNARFESIDRGEKNSSAFIDLTYHNWRWQNLYLRSQQNFMGSSASWSGEPDFHHRIIDGMRSYSLIEYKHEFSEQQQLEAALSYGRMSFEQYNYKAFANDTTLELTHQYQISKDLTWVGGLSLWYQDVGSTGKRSNAPVKSFNSLWQEAFGQFSYHPSAEWILTAGLQINKPEQGKQGLTPRLAASYDINEHWTIRSSYAKAYRAAFGVETNFDLILKNDNGSIRGGLRGNPNLSPERISNKELAINYHSKNAKVELACFHSKQSDLIGRLRASDNVLDFVNTASLKNSGIELTGNWHLSNTWSFNVAYTHQKNESGDGIEDHTLVPNDMVKAGVIYQDTHLTLGIFDSYFSAAPDVSIRNPNRQALNPNADSYHLMTAKLRYDISHWLNRPELSSHLELYLYNLLDQTIYQPEFVGRNINTIPARAQRSAYLTLTMNF
ncbi:hypothetical protein tinsulaeT_11800 [Thalassotalea insulae]|uniref:TonB-dependent receptor n=1 Tax=Thalassotalea insulae TaxID=2056778 RepID=A0ABQ6GT25_9GAMM|nr:TonB-dependent receptor [Thalassotalea insulae]GLX77840.1 hypothetical protein tinsulaeT_11800 [Thalassotalea insulae]